jgi:hypothetical protein
MLSTIALSTLALASLASAAPTPRADAMEDFNDSELALLLLPLQKLDDDRKLTSPSLSSSHPQLRSHS